jgi:hypothetical protein
VYMFVCMRIHTHAHLGGGGVLPLLPSFLHRPLFLSSIPPDFLSLPSFLLILVSHSFLIFLSSFPHLPPIPSFLLVCVGDIASTSPFQLLFLSILSNLVSFSAYIIAYSGTEKLTHGITNCNNSYRFHTYGTYSSYRFLPY